MSARPFVKTPTGKNAIYYHSSWSNYGRNYQVKDLPIDNLTDVSYAFFNVLASTSGSGFMTASGDSWADFDNPYIGKGVEPQNNWSSPPSDLGNFGQFHKLLSQGKKFNFSLALGGWTWSKYFSDAMSTQTNRQSLVDSIQAILMKYPNLFNGITIDWEYLNTDANVGNVGNTFSKSDDKNFIEFLKLLRSRIGNSYTISMCVTAAPEKIKFDVANVVALVDQLHIMTYDMHDGSWGETTSAHQANLRKSSFGKYSCEEAVATYLGYNIPSLKIFIGATLYSRGFSNTDGIGKPASGGSTDKSWEDGIVDYKKLPMAGATEYWDNQAKASYSYDPVKKILNSYDTVQSVKEKCQFVFDNNLGGIIVWESSGDVEYSNPRSIMKCLHDNLTHGKQTGITPSVPVKPITPGTIPTPAPVPVPNPQPVPAPTPQPAPTPISPAVKCQFCQICFKNSTRACNAKINPVNPQKNPTPGKRVACNYCSVCSKTVETACIKKTTPIPVPSQFQEWKVGTSYKANDVVMYLGKKYKCGISHTAIQSWSPGAVPALWSLLI